MEVKIQPIATSNQYHSVRRARRGFISRGHRGLFRNDFRLLHEEYSTPSPLENEIFPPRAKLTQLLNPVKLTRNEAPGKDK